MHTYFARIHYIDDGESLSKVQKNFLNIWFFLYSNSLPNVFLIHYKGNVMWLSKRLAWYIYLGLKIRVIVTNSHHNDGKMIFFFRVYHSIFCRILHNITTVYAIQEALKHCTSRKVIIVLVMRFENYVSDMH